MADPSACRDWYFRPARNAFNFGKKKRNHMGQCLGGGGGVEGGGGRRWVRQNSYFFFLRRTCLKPVAGRRF